MKKGLLEAPMLVVVTYVLAFLLGFYIFLSAVGDAPQDVIEGQDTRIAELMLLSFLNSPVEVEVDGEKEKMEMVDLVSLYHDKLNRKDDTAVYGQVLAEEINNFFGENTVNTVWTVYTDWPGLPGHTKWEFTSAGVLGNINLDKNRVSTIREIAQTCLSIPIYSREEPIKFEIILANYLETGARQSYDDLRSGGSFVC
tara:strand:+ start:583 stop:1176 length:594 start_codon:yes stop_codon:yes gene_type:complete